MACPTCNHTMELQHQFQESGYYWCPRCGTLAIKVANGVRIDGVPMLVERCREFERKDVRGYPPVDKGWRRLGIAEAINLPGNRLEP